MNSPLEKRRFSRITVSLPVEYHTRLPETDTPFQGQGILRDISLGGTYFHVDPGTSFQPGEVIRFDPPEPHRPQAGVALNFLGGLTFCATPAQQMF